MLLRPRISVRASTELVTFVAGSRSCTMVPCLYVDSHSPSAAVIAVGEAQVSEGSPVRVDLFHEPLHSLDYSRLLEAFLRHGFATVRRSLFTLRPRVHIVVAGSLQCFLRHYHRAVFFGAMIDAGIFPEHITIEDEQVA